MAPEFEVQEAYPMVSSRDEIDHRQSWIKVLNIHPKIDEMPDRLLLEMRAEQELRIHINCGCIWSLLPVKPFYAR